MRTSPVRAKMLFWLFAALAAYLLWRLYDVQVRRGPALAREAIDQRAQTVELQARRGTIFDRDRQVLVRSLPSESVYAVPIEVVDPAKTAAKLAAILHLAPQRLEPTLRDRLQFAWLDRKIPHEQAERIRALALPGIFVKEEETGVRYNPSGRLASTILGFTGIDESGLDGAELSLNALLRGRAGREVLETDTFGRAMPFGQMRIVESAKAGDSVALTIDSFLQFETERALRAQVATYHARSGTAIVMDPATGEILAMANVPDYDPAHYGASPPDAWRDRAVMDAYEPGSTFKLITAAAALESGRVTPATRFPARDSLEVGGRTIHNAEDGFMAGAGGTENLEDVIAYSHNVGAALVGQATGPRALYREIRKMGFGDPTEIELPGENPGIVPAPADWSGSSLATISFGHGISVTPIQLIRAYAAIANDGLLMRPRIVRELVAPDGATIYQYKPEIEQRVMRADTAQTLRGFLRAVVVRGTGNPSAQVPGYTTAGKTGTAQVVENGGYRAGAYIASFVGFIPAERPKYVILVKVERPVGAIYGSVVAAPVFATIAKAAMLHAGVLPATAPRRLVPAYEAAKR